MDISPRNEFDKINDNLTMKNINDEGIPEKVTLYKGLLKNLFSKTKVTKDKLDSYHWIVYPFLEHERGFNHYGDETVIHKIFVLIPKK